MVGRDSAGCSRPAHQTSPPVVEVDGKERAYIARIPEGYRPHLRHDLVLAFHGRTNSNSQVRDYFDLDEELPRSIIVYPAALPGSSGFRWSDAGDAPAELRDYSLLETLVAGLGDVYCIDLTRVFVVGHSLGASFANSVACHRPGLVRAVASVAGGIEGAACSGGVAALLMHHPEDRLVPFSEGLRAREAFRQANGLSLEAVPASEPELRALGCVRFGPDSPHPVVWCTHGDATTYGGRYYPHTWPDGAAAAIARFFADLP